jgi:hypothetical protein
MSDCSLWQEDSLSPGREQLREEDADTDQDEKSERESGLFSDPDRFQQEVREVRRWESEYNEDHCD